MRIITFGSNPSYMTKNHQCHRQTDIRQRQRQYCATHIVNKETHIRNCKHNAVNVVRKKYEYDNKDGSKHMYQIMYLPESRRQSVHSRLDDKCAEHCAEDVSLAATLQASRPQPSVGSELSITSQNCLRKHTHTHTHTHTFSSHLLG